jgi:SRSO17 transposase
LPLREPGAGNWLLIRKSLSDPSELAYYSCFAAENTALEELIRVAGSRWAVEECFQSAKNETGLDQYQVRGYSAWYRHITLSMADSAFLLRFQQVLRTSPSMRSAASGTASSCASPTPWTTL